MNQDHFRTRIATIAWPIALKPKLKHVGKRFLCLCVALNALAAVTFAQEKPASDEPGKTEVSPASEPASDDSTGESEKDSGAKADDEKVAASDSSPSSVSEAVADEMGADAKAAVEKAKSEEPAAKEGSAAVAKQEMESAKSDSSDSGATESRLNKIESKLDKLVETVSALVESKPAAKATEAAASASPSGSSTQAEGRERPRGGGATRGGGASRGEGASRGGGASRSEGRRGASDEKTPKLELKPEWLKTLPWRSLGPANMAGRVSDVEIHPEDSSLWWIATAGGGILKTSNRGTSVEHQFDQETTVSIGAIASDPQDKETLWVGTGEINPRNSVSYGDGVYKSTDGGKTYTNMGLEKTYQISRILVHPENSDIVYVGAQGRLYGTNEDRGVYKTTDGGKNWEKVLYLDERTGVIDMIMHPEEPDTLIVAMWDRLRDGFDSWPGSVEKPDGIDGYDPIRKWGPKGGLYKTTNGGKDWAKLSSGLPTGMTGRIGLDWQKKSPHAIYAIIDCEDIGKGPEPFSCYLGVVGKDEGGKAIVTQVMADSPADEAGIQVGDALDSADGEKLYKFDELLAALREKEAGERISLTISRDDEVMDFSPKLEARPGSRGGAAEPYYGIVGEDQGGRIVLTKVTEDGPAAKAGLQEGDIILTVGGEEPDSYAKWIEETNSLAIGDEVALQVKRDNEEMEIKVTLGKRPVQGGQSRAYAGLRGENAESGGAKLSTITEKGPSDKAGLKAGDVVTKVGDKPIKTYEEFIQEIRDRQPKDTMPLEITRGERKLKIDLVLGDRNASSGDRPFTYSYFGQLPNAQDQQGVDGYKYGGVYKSTDAGESWTRVNSLNVRPMYFSVVRVDPSDDQRVYVLGVSQFQSDSGGSVFTSDLGRDVHADAHDMWIDPDDGRHMVIGCDGGFYETYDRGQQWDHINTAAVGQFYHVTIAPSQPYWVYGGLQDNGSWGGPAIGLSGGVLNEDWISVGGGDGFVCRVDPEDTDVVYTESQNGSIRRRNLRTGEGASIRPRPAQGQEFRFNWKTPFILSHHNSKVFYSAGNYVFRSLDRGDNLKVISPEITLTDRGSATEVSESPLDSDVLYVGTDDGALWVTKDGGENWEDIRENLGVDPMWVSTIEASRYKAGRVYVCLDGHRSDNDDPHIFVSDDYGKTFKNIGKDLPRGSSRCLREDILNENLLYLGTEFAFWVSIDGGQSWAQFNQSLPTVAIHDVAQDSSVSEIVLATHGRSLWACDVTGLRGLSTAEFGEKAALLPPADVIRWRRESRRGGTNRRYASENPDSGAMLWYSLPKEAQKVALKIEDVSGNTLAELDGRGGAGLHRVDWNLITQASGRGRRQFVSTGDYKVSLLVDGEVKGTEILSIKQDPTLPPDALTEAEFEAVNALLEVSEEENEEGDDGSNSAIGDDI